MPRGTKKSNEDLMRGMRRTYGGLPEFEAIAATIEVWPEPKNKAGKKRSSAAHAEDYVSDDGFIANGSDGGGPKKKAKTTAKPTTKAAVANKGGEEFWELTGTRRVQVSEFKNMQMVNIREYYEKDGEILPSKKGISLTMSQYNAFLAVIPQIEASLTAKGEKITRPDYDVKEEENVKKDSEDSEAEATGAKEDGKKNFESTSEDED